MATTTILGKQIDALSALSALSASYATTASYALSSAGGGAAFPYTGSAQITGSLGVTGSIIATAGFTGSLQGTASWATNASTATSAATWTTSRTITIGSTGKTVDGSGNVSWTLGEIGAYSNTNPSGYTTNTGTVTSVATAGSVNGITLTGGTITGTGTITLGGTLSGIGNAQLTNSSITIGSTAISLGASSTTLGGLTNVTSTNFTGSLQGTASWSVSSSRSTITSNIETIDDTSGGYVTYPVFTKDGAGVSAVPRIDSTGLTYRPDTNTLTVANFAGNATSAATASKVTTGLTTFNATYYLPFVDNNSNLASAIGTVGNLTFNPSIGSLNATSFTGSLRGTASYATVASQSGYTMQFVLATTGSNLAASTTYYMGAPVTARLVTSTGTTRVYVPRPGRVRNAYIYVRTNGTLAGAGTSTFTLQKNSSVGSIEALNTSTTACTTANAIITSTAVSMSVSIGDYLEIQFFTPAWGTLPTAVEANAIIYIENNI